MMALNADHATEVMTRIALNTELMMLLMEFRAEDVKDRTAFHAVTITFRIAFIAVFTGPASAPKTARTTDRIAFVTTRVIVESAFHVVVHAACTPRRKRPIGSMASLSASVMMATMRLNTAVRNGPNSPQYALHTARMAFTPVMMMVRQRFMYVVMIVRIMLNTPVMNATTAFHAATIPFLAALNAFTIAGTAVPVIHVTTAMTTFFTALNAPLTMSRNVSEFLY